MRFNYLYQETELQPLKLLPILVLSNKIIFISLNCKKRELQI